MSNGRQAILKEKIGNSQKEFEAIINEFFIPDEIDFKKFIANYNILKNGSREIYKASANLLGEEDLSELGTKGIDILTDPLKCPVSYPIWFLAAYPDVVMWFALLVQKTDTTESALEGEIIFGDGTQQDIISSENYIRPSYLQKMVDEYVKKNGSLECAND